MSVSLMAAAFRVQTTPTRKLVLLALCDSANDHGECYPSVAHLVDKCSLGERTIQDALAALEAAGHVRRELRPGRATVYWCTPTPTQQPNPAAAAPRSSRTPQQPHPAAAAPATANAAPPPPQQPHPTPANAAPITITEPSVEPSLKRKAAAAQTPPPPPFAGDVNLESLNGKHVVLLADGWELPEAWGNDAEALGWQPRDVLREAEKFRQFWTAGKGSGTRRSVKGWRQSWSNWLSNAERYRR